MRCMYSAVSGLRNYQVRMDVIANNIANVNTVGFKAGQLTFQDAVYETLRASSAPTPSGGSTATIGGTTPHQVGTGVAINTIGTVFTQGAVLNTGNSTDLMILGNGFFRLRRTSDADSEVLYTRAGVFGFDKDGQLINKSNGMYVLDTDDQVIKVEDFATKGTVIINSYGQVVVDGTPTVTISLAKFPGEEYLERMGENLFRGTAAAGEPVKGYAGDSSNGFGSTVILAGALEASNVDLTLEFSDMIITQRGFQANARTITTSDEMLQEVVNLKR